MLYEFISPTSNMSKWSVRYKLFHTAMTEGLTDVQNVHDGFCPRGGNHLSIHRPGLPVICVSSWKFSFIDLLQSVYTGVQVDKLITNYWCSGFYSFFPFWLLILAFEFDGWVYRLMILFLYQYAVDRRIFPSVVFWEH